MCKTRRGHVCPSGITNCPLDVVPRSMGLGPLFVFLASFPLCDTTVREPI